MTTPRSIALRLLLVALAAGAVSAEPTAKTEENAALRYWSAFALMQDSAITDDQAKQLPRVVDGSLPYDDQTYRDLVDKNKPALKTMERASRLPTCDWGLDYSLGSEAPVDYVRKGLALGRLNILYAYQNALQGDRADAIATIAAGLRFSQDLANGGSLLATLTAKNLISGHLAALALLSSKEGLSGPHRLLLEKILARQGPSGLDWESAINREFKIPLGWNAEDSRSLARILTCYLSVLHDRSGLPELQHTIATASLRVKEFVPNPKRVLDEKQDLTDKIARARLLLQ
jgi:hypothetical protein